MKKIFILLVSLFCFAGCSTNIDNTPTKKVEKFLSKYQILDESVTDDLDNVINEEERFNTASRENYKEVIKTQYKDMTYIIKKETVNGDKATVEVEITVYDYKKVMNEAEIYKINNIQLFSDEFGIYDETKYVDYIIEKLKETKDRIKYTLYLNTTYKDEIWEVDQIDDTAEDKILGIYSY